MPSNIVVSVCVVTYNQEQYIEQCLRSIVTQKTDFNFELIVGEDCSPDRTSEIVKKIADEYPKIGIPVLRQKNIGGHKNFMDVFERARGEFIAYCEGDDYWIDPLKLQKQYDALQRHPDIDLCFHPAKAVLNEKHCSIINSYRKQDFVVLLDQVIEGRGGFMPSASLFIRKSSIFPFPEWFVARAAVGDTFIQALGASRGGALFLPEVMSVYNRFSDGSSTERNLQRRSLDSIKAQAEDYDYCYKKLAEMLSDSAKIPCRIALSQSLFDLSVKALDAGYVELFKSLFDRAWPDMKNRSLFVRLVWVARYVPACRQIVRRKLVHKRSLVVT